VLFDVDRCLLYVSLVLSNGCLSVNVLVFSSTCLKLLCCVDVGYLDCALVVSCFVLDEHEC